MTPCNGGDIMSRSYKKTPVYQDGYGLKSLYWYKRSANKKVRRTTEIDSGKSYRKIYDTWTFRDYVFRETLNEYKIELERDLKSCLIVYGSYDNFPNYYKKRLDDKDFRLWKKIYYWK